MHWVRISFALRSEEPSRNASSCSCERRRETAPAECRSISKDLQHIVGLLKCEFEKRKKYYLYHLKTIIGRIIDLTSTANVVQNVLHVAVVVVTETQLGFTRHELGYPDGAIGVLELTNHAVLTLMIAVASMSETCKVE